MALDEATDAAGQLFVATIRKAQAAELARRAVCPACNGQRDRIVTHPTGVILDRCPECDGCGAVPRLLTFYLHADGDVMSVGYDNPNTGEPVEVLSMADIDQPAAILSEFWLRFFGHLEVR